jgi:hypothetical protein
MALGAAIGLVTDNIGLWLSLGLVFGAAMSVRHAKKNAQTDSKIPTSSDDNCDD